MRNPNRISPLCVQIANLWQNTCPDLRFMQLMSDFAMWYGADPYYMEDDEFLRQFHKFINEITVKNAKKWASNL